MVCLCGTGANAPEAQINTQPTLFTPSFRCSATETLCQQLGCSLFVVGPLRHKQTNEITKKVYIPQRSRRWVGKGGNVNVDAWMHPTTKGKAVGRWMLVNKPRDNAN